MVWRLLKYVFAAAIAAIFVFLAILLLIPPERPPVSFTDVDTRGWMPGEPVGIEMQAPDTLHRHRLRIIVRCDSRFMPDTLPLAVTLSVGGKVISNDTLNTGVGTATSPSHNAFEISLPYLEGVVFPRRDTFSVSVSHLSSAEVKGITAIGVSLE